MTTYKQLVAAALQTLVDRGLTHREIAKQIGLENGNVVTMHLNPSAPIAPFPLNRLPALARASGLTPYESTRLVHARAKCHPDRASAMDTDTFAWLLRSGVGAAREVKARRSSVAATW